MRHRTRHGMDDEQGNFGSGESLWLPVEARGSDHRRATAACAENVIVERNPIRTNPMRVRCGALMNRWQVSVTRAMRVRRLMMMCTGKRCDVRDAGCRTAKDHGRCRIDA